MFDPDDYADSMESHADDRDEQYSYWEDEYLEDMYDPTLP